MDARSTDLSAVEGQAKGRETGLIAILIRAEAVRRGDVQLVLRTVAEKGLDPLLQLDVDTGIRPAFDRWTSKNAFGINSAEIASVVFAHDLQPITPSSDERRDHPQCDNARALLTRYAVETEVNRQRAGRGPYVPAVPIASSAQTWSLLAALAADRAPFLKAEMGRRSAAFPKLPSISDLSRYACRARVELIERNGEKVVRKTFRPGSERYLDRELEVFRCLGPVCAAIPKLLEAGSSSFIMEYIDTAEQLPMSGSGLLPLTQVRELAAFIRTCVARGFDPIDLKPRGGNALYTRSGVKIIDYEFWRRCDPSIPPERSYCLAGLPADYDDDRPWGLEFPFTPYPLKWRRVVGLSPKSFLYDPPWLQRLKRLPWAAAAILRRGGRAAARLAPGRGRADGTRP